MADTLEEALSFLGSGNTGESEVEVLEIDSDLRTIRIPEDFVFGVYNDKNVYDVHFTMPRYYRGIDLSEFNIQVNYMTPVNVGNIYLVESPTVEEESIDFVWILDRGVFLAAGSVQFSVCLRQIGEDGAVLKEFNTTIARANVLSGLEIENIEDPESYSLLAHMKQVEERVERQGDAVFASYSDLRDMFDTTQNTQAELSEQISKSPRFAATISEMTDTEDMYIYTGSEPNYRFGAWYYYDTDTNSWKMYGEVNVDSTLTVSGVPADAKVVGDRLAVKANVSDVNRALNTKADVDDVEDALDLKANIADMNAALNLKANVSDVNTALTAKADADDVTSALADKLDKTGDSKDLTTTFTSSDVADGSASAWTSVGALANTEKHSSIFAKVSQMFKNVRYLFKMLGTTDISSIGNGTVSGALSTLNSETFKETISGSTLLPSGADLNDYNVIGSYYTTSASLTNTILNKPSDIQSAAFRLLVLDVGYGVTAKVGDQAGFCVQLIFGPGKAFSRSFNNGTTWSEWKTVWSYGSPDVVELDASTAKRDAIGANVSIETVTTPGVYFVADGALDKPSGSGSGSGGIFILSFSNGSYYTSLYMSMSATDTGIIWRGIRHDNESTVWKRITPNMSNIVSATVSDSTLLPSGADLNDYRIPGVYHTSSSVLTNTILNRPLDSIAFRLIVQDTGYGYGTTRTGAANFCNQIAYASGSMYMRNWGSNSWSDWKTILNTSSKDIAKLSTVTSYQATYVSNSYTIETDVKRIWVYREGMMGYVHFNLAVSTALPSSAGSITIGKISGPTLRTYYTVIVPSQTVSGSQLLVNIQQNGNIEITNHISSINASGFYRAEIPVSFTD